MPQFSTTTNEKLGKVRAEINNLIQWAQADAEHARDNNAKHTAKDDLLRAKLLRKADALLTLCNR